MQCHVRLAEVSGRPAVRSLWSWALGSWVLMLAGSLAAQASHDVGPDTGSSEEVPSATADGGVGPDSKATKREPSADGVHKASPPTAPTESQPRDAGAGAPPNPYGPEPGAKAVGDGEAATPSATAGARSAAEVEAAAGTSAGASQGDVATAKAHFNEGRAMFRSRRFREAIRAFELARALWPSAELLFNIGRAYEELGDYRAAIRHFQGYLRDAVQAEDAADVRRRIADLEARYAQLEAHRARGERIGALRVGDGGESAMAVWVNGREETALRKGEQIFVPPGTFRLSVRWPDASPYDAEVQVRAGELTSAYPTRTTPTPVAQADAFTPSPWFWSAVGVAGLSFTAAVTLGSMVPLRRAEQPDTADRLALGSDVALGTAIVAAIGSALVYLAEQHGS